MAGHAEGYLVDLGLQQLYDVGKPHSICKEMLWLVACCDAHTLLFPTLEPVRHGTGG